MENRKGSKIVNAVDVEKFINYVPKALPFHLSNAKDKQPDSVVQ